MTKLINRVVSIYKRKTSMRLATEEWEALEAICKRESLKRKRLLEMIEDHKAPKLGLTCCVRIFVLSYMHRLAFSDLLKEKPNDSHKDVYRVFGLIS
ncbi:MAG: ribbon-helix-helix domain-containing protein [Alphaproteobacteria bacterium]|nr:ribbon-helix-helix domain-containing protein [Alphaproteobacteria bacterium]